MPSRQAEVHCGPGVVVDAADCTVWRDSLGDKAETIAIKTVFGDHAYKVSISSTKSQLGHLLGASGGVEMVICMKALAENVCPPTINYTTPDPACDLDYTPNVPRERPLKVVMSNSFGFGGHPPRRTSIIAGAAA